MVKIRKTVCVLLSMVMVMECSVNVRASINSKNVNKSIKILKEDCRFNDDTLDNIFELTLSILDNEELKKEDLSIGDNISIYNVEEEKMFNICPVLNSENECVTLAQISDGEYVSVNDDIELYENVLKNANKGKDSIVYISDGVIYIEDKNEKTELEEGTVDNYGARFVSSECAIKKFVNQGNYRLCWAATTATIVNYKKKKKLSAKNVADAMGVGYNVGAGSDMVKKALNLYGLNYYDIKSSKVSWYTVKNMISNKKRPLCMGLRPVSPGKDANMITIYGYAYDPEGSYKVMKVWDSNGIKTGIKYSTKVYLYGYEYRWIETLC